MLHIFENKKQLEISNIIQDKTGTFMLIDRFTEIFYQDSVQPTI